MRSSCHLSSPTIWTWWSRERSTIPHSQNGITLARPAHTMGGPGPLDRIVLGPRRQGPKLDRGRVVDLSRGRAQHKKQPACQSWKRGRPKLLEDVKTPRRFIYKALQKVGMIPCGVHREDSCLMHLGVLHDMETCSEVRDLLQRMIDQGRLEIDSEGKEEQIGRAHV